MANEELETCIAACESFIKWSEPPRPEGMSPDAQRAAINHAWLIVKGAARDNLRRAQEPEPNGESAPVIDVPSTPAAKRKPTANGAAATRAARGARAKR